jgi:hypothetical protein
MLSPASMAKSYLEELHVSHPSGKVNDADAAYGVFMQSYFGGRGECRIRSWEVPVCLVDFMSQYPDRGRTSGQLERWKNSSPTRSRSSSKGPLDLEKPLSRVYLRGTLLGCH